MARKQIIDIIREYREKYSIPFDWNSYVTFNGYVTQLLSKKYNDSKDKLVEFTDISYPFKLDQYYGCVKTENYALVIDNDIYDERMVVYVFCNDKGLKEIEKILKVSPPPKRKKMPLRPGVFSIIHTMFGPMLEPIDLKDAPAPILNDGIFDKITTEVMTFQKKEKVYEKLKMDYKRGFLLYGAPGSGKTQLIKYLLSKLKADNVCGIMCKVTNANDIEVMEEILSEDKEYLKIVIFEDIDGMRSDNRSELLNLIDGVSSVHNAIFIATTNFPKNLDVAIVNRPSRFDGFFQIGLPNKRSRELLLKRFIPNISNKDLKETADITEGFTGAFIKEISVQIELCNYTPQEAAKHLNKQMEIFKEFKGGDD